MKNLKPKNEKCSNTIKFLFSRMTTWWGKEIWTNNSIADSTSGGCSWNNSSTVMHDVMLIMSNKTMMSKRGGHRNSHTADDYYVGLKPL